MAQTTWADYEYADEVQTALDRGERRSTRLLLYAICAFFVVAIIWADNAMIDEVTRGPGRVISSSQLQVVQSLDGGIVEAILTREGDIVEQGQVLLRIDDTGLSSTVGELRAQRLGLRLQLMRLEAEIAGLDELEVPADMAEQAPGLVQDAVSLFTTRREGLQTQLNILRQQADQRESELDEMRFQRDSAEESLRLIQEELEIIQPRAERGIVSRTELLRLTREANDLAGSLEVLNRSLQRGESAIREAYERIQETFLQFRSEAQAEYNQRQSELSVIEETLRAAVDRADRTEVRSPVAGVVNAVNVSSIGEVVRPADTLVEIVPIEDSLLIEARIRPGDVAFLRPGLPATVKVTAYDFAIYGGLEGTIERISADTFTDEMTGEAYYLVVVRTEENTLGPGDDPLPIIPGMVTSVDILTGEKSILDYLLKPILRARDEALRER